MGRRCTVGEPVIIDQTLIIGLGITCFIRSEIVWVFVHIKTNLFLHIVGLISRPPFILILILVFFLFLSLLLLRLTVLGVVSWFTTVVAFVTRFLATLDSNPS